MHGWRPDPLLLTVVFRPGRFGAAGRFFSVVAGGFYGKGGKRIMKQSGRIAVGGVFSALALACMLMTIFPYATYALPAMAGVCLIPVVLELGWRWGWMAYAVTALLSPLLAADKEAALLFIAFFGYYPVLKAWIERRKSRVIEWAIKLLLFNAAMVAAYMAAIFVFRLPVDFEIFGVSLPFVLLALGNVTFLIYDKALTGLVSLYLYRLQPKLHRMFKY